MIKRFLPIVNDLCLPSVTMSLKSLNKTLVFVLTLNLFVRLSSSLICTLKYDVRNFSFSKKITLIFSDQKNPIFYYYGVWEEGGF